MHDAKASLCYKGHEPASRFYSPAEACNMHHYDTEA